MFRRLAALFGFGDQYGPTQAPEIRADPRAPFPTRDGNILYDRLFCEQLPPLMLRNGEEPAHHWQWVLYSERPVPAEVVGLAADPKQESRVRAYAYHWMRAKGHPVPSNMLLCVVIEVALDEGLVVLAAHADGSVRHLDARGISTVVEDGSLLRREVDALFVASSQAAAQLGPDLAGRLPPPARGRIRATFVSADGRRFDENEATLMSASPRCGPVVGSATELLRALLDLRARGARNN